MLRHRLVHHFVRVSLSKNVGAVSSKQYQSNITHLLILEDVLLDDVKGFGCLLNEKFPNSALGTPHLVLEAATVVSARSGGTSHHDRYW